MALERETKILIAGLSLLSGVGLATNIGTNTSTGCETYQGYRNNSADGERVFVFDEKTLEERLNGTNYALSGDPEMYRDLKIGNEYRLKIREPLMGSNRLISTEDCDENSD